MTERSSLDASGAALAPSDQFPPPQANAALTARALPTPTLPTLAAPPSRGPIVASPGKYPGLAPVMTPRRNEPARRGPMRLLIWSIVIVALVATGGYLTGLWDPTSDTSSAPANDGSGAAVDSTPGLAPTAGPTDAAAGVCVELQQVEVLSNEISLVVNAAVQELAASPGEIDEAAALARLQEAADLMDRSLSDLLNVYESAALVAPPDVAADLRIVADGTALMTPAMTAVLRNARTLDDLAGMDQVLEAPELAQAAVAAGTASLRLDEFTIPTCGFKFSN